MKYYFSKILKGVSFEDAIARVTDKLKEEGFGVLTDIDMQQTLKKKLDVDIKKYRILGACNPPFAYKAMQAEDKIGLMLPCNVIIQEQAPGVIEVSAIDPVASMQSIDNSELAYVADEVRAKLNKVIEGL